MDATSPMPPTGALSPSAFAAFAAWVGAGAPRGACGVRGDAGASPRDGGSDPFATPPRCSSGMTWTRGNFRSENMNPGQACVACHQRMPRAPRFSVAGTVFRTAHEPDDCVGGAGAETEQVTVELTDAMGRVFRLVPKVGSGNFFLEAAVATPYRARVLFQGRSIAMSAPQTSGDCNSCHTQSGAMGAPGRIILP
jgi:hypothetical protein